LIVVAAVPPVIVYPNQDKEQKPGYQEYGDECLETDDKHIGK